MSTYTPEQGCPKCGGKNGYEFTMTESHAMSGSWGGLAQSGDNGDMRVSLVSCIDCSHRFQMKTLANLGAVAGQDAICVQHFD